MEQRKSAIVLNAAEYSFGRLASRAAFYLQGKHVATYRPNVLGGTQVIVKNLHQIRFSGTKLDTSVVHRYSGYPGGIKTETLRRSFERSPEAMLRRAVLRMLPKNRLAAKRIKNLVITKHAG